MNVHHLLGHSPFFREVRVGTHWQEPEKQGEN